MESFGEIIGAGLVAVFFALVFYYAFKVRGPWGNFWTFFLVLLLAVWAASLWITPFGPKYYGIAWIPLFLVGLIFALLLAAMPTTFRSDDKITPTAAEMESSDRINRTVVTVSGVFWIFLLILVIAIIAGYAR